MTSAVDRFDDPNTLFGRLRSACAEEWDRAWALAVYKAYGLACLACVEYYSATALGPYGAQPG
jgi:hypothetical protein